MVFWLYTGLMFVFWMFLEVEFLLVLGFGVGVGSFRDVRVLGGRWSRRSSLVVFL